MSEWVTTRWWWIRHAPVVDNGGRIYGQGDVPADLSDRLAFAALARAVPVDALWVTSHLARARDTASAIMAEGCPASEPLVERELAEQHLGSWQGEKRAEVFRRHADWRRLWIAPAAHAPPGGESFVQVVGRVTAAIERLTRAHAGRDIVAVSHGGPIRAALALALALEPEAALAFAIDNLSLTRLDHVRERDSGTRSAWRVVAVNHGAGAVPAGRPFV
ncbi:MAG: histidine phosphatase family protein [Alphaproteobacteria bacterium]